MWPETIRQARRLVVLVVGLTLLLCGVVMLVIPGPGSLVILAGLGVLALEFAWARRWLQILRDTAGKGARSLNLRSLFSRRRSSAPEGGNSAAGGN